MITAQRPYHIIQTMPQNHENTKSHKKSFNPISSELEDKIICEINAIDLVNPIWKLNP